MSTFQTDPRLLESELERAQANVADLKRQLAGKTVELQQMLGVLGTYQQNAGAPPPETDQVRALNASLADMNTKFQDLVAEQSRTQQRNEMLMAHLGGQAGVDLSQLGGGSDEFKKKYEEAAAQLAGLQQEMAGHVSMRTALEGRINELQNYISTIQQAYNDQQQLVQTKHNEAYQLSTYVESMRPQLEAAAESKAKFDAANDKVNELTESVTRLRGEVEELLAENEKLKNQPPPEPVAPAPPPGPSSEEFAALETRLKESAEQAAMAEQLAITVDDLQRKLAVASKQSEGSEQMQRELEQLSLRLSEATEQADRQANDNAALASQHAEAMAALEAQLTQVQQALGLAEERVAGGEAELAMLREQAAKGPSGPTPAEEALQAQIKEWKTKLAASEKERWELGPKVEELQKQNELSRQRTNVLLQKNRESFISKLEDHDKYIYGVLRELRTRLDQAEEELRRRAEETAPPPT